MTPSILYFQIKNEIEGTETQNTERNESNLVTRFKKKKIQSSRAIEESMDTYESQAMMWSEVKYPRAHCQPKAMSSANITTISNNENDELMIWFLFLLYSV